MGTIAVIAELENVLQRCEIFYVCSNKWIRLVFCYAGVISSRSISHADECPCTDSYADSDCNIYANAKTNTHTAHHIYANFNADGYTFAFRYTYSANGDSVNLMVRRALCFRVIPNSEARRTIYHFK